MTLQRQSYCKVNFILNILGKRPDGYHELETLLYPVRLADTLEFTRGGVEIALTCSRPDLPVDSGNLVWRAARAFLDAGRIREGVQIHLEKRLPVAAGIGGGSSNAACALLALNELFPGAVPQGDLLKIAEALGADVPFFLQDQPALGLGKGERIEPLGAFESLRGFYLLLAHPGFGISTPWAYKSLARFPQAAAGAPGRARRLANNLRAGNLSAAWSDFYNSLEAPALEKHPILELYQRFFITEGAAVTLMSGSGSSTFALVDGEQRAEEMVARFRSEFGESAWLGLAPA